jgi:hypothetical protein
MNRAADPAGNNLITWLRRPRGHSITASVAAPEIVDNMRCQVYRERNQE